jgi:hypothetical protein
MNRSVALSVVVLVVSLFVGGALKAQAATSSAPRAVPAVQSVDNGSTDGGSGYWAAWADAASH